MSASLLQHAGRCVACGLCLPHCSTYRKNLDEGDSPRGRIALMQAVLHGQLPMNERFTAHIDGCLSCRACENACPNHVAYGALVDGVRSLLERQRNPTATQRLLRRGALWLLAYPESLAVFAALLRLYRLLGLSHMVQRLGSARFPKLARWEAALPERIEVRGWQSVYPASAPVRGEVALFLGCVARHSDATTLDAAVFLLNRLGYTVRVPAGQTCCGALHRRHGELDKARALATQNVKAFDVETPVISTASGCGAMLCDYAQDGGMGARDFSVRVVDISAFLIEAEGWERLAIQPLAARVAVHDPCSLVNVVRAPAPPYALLRRIPGVVVEPLVGNDQCCGAAGSYFLTQPQMADALLRDKIEAVNACSARFVATSNTGCTMFLQSGLRTAESPVEVLHPIVLLARQAGFGG
ncbi:MAG: (Fe-S)-binding protein [Burkholderiales bacterium]